MIKISCIQRDLQYPPHRRGYAKIILIKIYDSILYYHKFLSSLLSIRSILRIRTYERLYSSKQNLISTLTSRHSCTVLSVVLYLSIRYILITMFIKYIMILICYSIGKFEGISGHDIKSQNTLSTRLARGVSYA